MMIYKIEIERAAHKFINSRNKKEKAGIFAAISKLPHEGDITKMTGYKYRFRLRVGDIRIIYEKFDDVLRIMVIDAGMRGDIYK